MTLESKSKKTAQLFAWNLEINGKGSFGCVTATFSAVTQLKFIKFSYRACPQFKTIRWANCRVGKATACPPVRSREIAGGHAVALPTLRAPSDSKTAVLSINRDNIWQIWLINGVKLRTRPSRRAWVQLIKGQIQLNHDVLHPGDGAAVVDENMLHIICDTDAELLLFDLVNWR